MIRKTLLFRNLLDNIPKNIGLYAVGILLLVISGYSFDVLAILMGLIAFIISYSSVYVLNDLFDIIEDEMTPEKHKRKPLVRGSVEKDEAIRITLSLLIIGLLLSLLVDIKFLGIVIMLIIINAFYSIPIFSLSSPFLLQESQESRVRPTSLKHSIAALPLVSAMQILKLLLPWTLTTNLAQFPFLFALGFSLLYVVIFKGYKKNLALGESVKHEPQLIGAAALSFCLSMLVHSGPILQASIFLYLFVGIAIFRNFRLIDKTVIILSPVYILLGVIILFWLIFII
ncbi:MAG: UbiA family prenyltransferase [Candidatus Thorarchaeota archaeon]